MNVYVSGVAARAVFVRHDHVTYIDADCPNEERRAPRSLLGMLLQDAHDIVELGNVTREEALDELLRLWKHDRALRMLQVAQSTRTELADAMSAVQFLDSLLEDTGVVDRVTSVTSALPTVAIRSLADFPDPDRWPRASALLAEVNNLQPSIAHIRDAWHHVDASLFRDDGHHANFEKAAIDNGVFRAFVKAHAEKKDVTGAVFEAYIVLMSQPNSRAIIKDWEKRIGLPRTKSAIDWLEITSEDAEERDDHIDELSAAQKGRIYQKVLNAQGGIVDCLRKSEINKAERYCQDLIEFQLNNGEPKYASMSLCSLAQAAKLFGYPTLALQWTVRAVSICPSDGWAEGQSADAYMALHKFADAEKSYRRSIVLGEDHFGRIGLARTLKATQHLDEALREFREISVDYPGHKEGHRAFTGIAEVLREMAEPDRALAAYDEGIQAYPNQAVLLTGRAQILKEQGRLQDALQSFEGVRAHFPEDPQAWAGSADVLKLLGRYDDALRRYDETVAAFPDLAIGYCGRGDVYLEAGKYDKALSEYENAYRAFPYDPVAHSGYAEALRQTGNLEKSAAVYAAGVERFPHEPYLRAGQANIARLQGRLEEALSFYDRAHSEFPYMLMASMSRAHVLKELGKYDLALEALSRVIKVWPRSDAARYQKASVLAIKARFSEALELLPTSTPRTRDEWVAAHIRSMVLLRTDRSDEAEAIIRHALVANPFAKERRYFENSLALIDVRRGRFDAALRSTEQSESVLANVISLHSYAALGRSAEAQHRLATLAGDPRPRVVLLSNEIGARYRVTAVQPTYDDAWIAEAETEVALALAA